MLVGASSSSGLFITFASLAPVKQGSSISFPNVLQVHILLFKSADWVFNFCFEPNNYHVTMLFFFFSKHDNIPQIPNAVIVNGKKIHCSILFFIKMLNFHDQCGVIFFFYLYCTSVL